MKVPVIMKRKYLDIDLILISDDLGLLDEVTLPDSNVNILDLLDCNCRKYCVNECVQIYMDRNVEAYR
jgi:hypothetical protein